MARFIRLFAALALLCLAASASASIRPAPEGEAPTLRPDEGPLLIDVDATAPISELRFVRAESDSGRETITHLARDRSTCLFVVTAGAYRWSRLHYEARAARGFHYDLHQNPEFHFDARPGVINYPGDLVSRLGQRGFLHAPNRGLLAIDRLRAHAPDLYARYPFAYSGHYPDPFPEFYKAARAGHPERSDADIDRSLPLPSPCRYRSRSCSATRACAA